MVTPLCPRPRPARSAGGPGLPRPRRPPGPARPAARGRPHASSAPPWPTARSSTTRSAGSRTCPRGWGRRAGARPLPAAQAQRRAALRLRRGPHRLEEVDLPGPRAAHQRHEGRPQGRASRPRPPSRPGSPSWASAPASSPRSAIQDRVLLGRPATSTPTTPLRRAQRLRRSPSSAPRRRRPASAPRWAPAPRSTGRLRPRADRARRRLPGGGRVAPPAARSCERLPLGPATSAEQYGAAATVAAGPGAHRRPGARPPASTTASWPSSTTRAGPRSPSAASPAATAPSPARPASAPTLTQATDLTGDKATTTRTWDSCFSPGFAKVAGGSFRARPRDRYRQWLTHKFATWMDQFGTLRLRGLRPLHHLVPGRHRRARRAQRDRAGRPARPRDAARWSRSRRRPTTSSRPASSHSKQETADTTTLTLTGVDAGVQPGVHGPVRDGRAARLPAAARSRISRFLPDGIELTIRGAGPATKAMCALQVGDQVGLRGPLGNNWPLDRAVGRDLVIVTGGIGLAPLRPVLHAIVAGPPPVRRRAAVLRRPDPGRPALPRRAGALGRPATASRSASPSTAPARTGRGRVGIVTHLFDQAAWDGTNMIAFVCGPERMMQATATTLAGRGVPASPHLRDARAPHGVRHRAVRPLPDGQVLRLP